MRCPCMAWLPLSVNISIVQLHFVIMLNDYVYNVNAIIYLSILGLKFVNQLGKKKNYCIDQKTINWKVMIIYENCFEPCVIEYKFFLKILTIHLKISIKLVYDTYERFVIKDFGQYCIF
jgi:hypothetical protein